MSRGIRSPVTATRNDHCKVTLPWHECCNLSTDSASEASNIDVAKHEILPPATRNASFRSLDLQLPPRLPTFFQPSRTPALATYFAVNVSKSLRLPRETQFEGPKTPRAPGVLTILASELLSRAGVPTSSVLKVPAWIQGCQPQIEACHQPKNKATSLVFELVALF